MPSTGKEGAIISLTTGGGGSFPSDAARTGTYIYDDLSRDSTPLSVPASTPTPIPNDAQGGLTGNKPVSGVNDVWNPVTGEFDFTGLNVGDFVEIRLDMTVQTTSLNQTVFVEFQGGIGAPNPFSLVFIDTPYLFAGTYDINRYTPVFMIDASSTDFPGRLVITSDDPVNVSNIRFFVQTTVRGA